MIRKYGFELFHLALWALIGVLLFFQSPVAIPAGLFAIAVCATAFAVHALHRRVKASLLILAAPVLTFAIVLPLGRSGALNWVEFHSARRIYEARILSAPRIDHEPRLVAFHMDDRGWLATGPTIFETLVYDESDEMGKPEAQRSPAWYSRASGRLHFHSILQPQSDTHSVTVTPMGHHWFWVEQVMK